MKQGEKYTLIEKGEGPWKKQTEERESEMCPWVFVSPLFNHYEIKRCLLLGMKVMSNLGSILKSRDITLPTKVRLVKATVFPMVMYGCESWTVKKAEH